jgi:hypothetical protein
MTMQRKKGELCYGLQYHVLVDQRGIDTIGRKITIKTSEKPSRDIGSYTERFSTTSR